MPEPLTRRDLDAARCDTPGCAHEDHSELWLVAVCHPRAGLAVRYELVRGALVVSCKRCNVLIAEIAVASGPADSRRVS